MVQEIKTIVANMLNTMRLSDAIFGTVDSVSPLVVKVDLKLIIGEASMVVPEHLKAGAYGTGMGLQVGDCVVMLRCMGGQRYVLLGRIT